MKLTISGVVAALCWSYRLAAANTHVYTLDRPAIAAEGTQLESELSPQIARMVLAQRAGVEDYHEVDLKDEDALKTINGYAYSSSEGMFGQGQKTTQFILLEGQDDTLAFLDRAPQFSISHSPSPNATRGLFLDLARQALPEFLSSSADDEVYTILKGGANHRDEQGARRIIIWSDASKVQSYIEEVTTSEDSSDVSITIITTPSSHTKGSKSADYGSYAMPASAQSPLRKRQQPASEEPLEVSPSSLPVTSDTTPVSSLADQGDPLPGILPACFPSLSACESMTRNCSGHGSCGKKYTDADAPKDSRYKNCFACQCSATTKESGSGGVTTTYWAGPACQKKDVSVQFWLIALFSVAMVGLISFAIGQVWSMGDEELPSVIGAGVSGPVKRS